MSDGVGLALFTHRLERPAGVGHRRSSDEGGSADPFSGSGGVDGADNFGGHPDGHRRVFVKHVIVPVDGIDDLSSRHVWALRGDGLDGLCDDGRVRPCGFPRLDGGGVQVLGYEHPLAEHRPELVAVSVGERRPTHVHLGQSAFAEVGLRRQDLARGCDLSRTDRAETSVVIALGPVVQARHHALHRLKCPAVQGKELVVVLVPAAGSSFPYTDTGPGAVVVLDEFPEALGPLDPVRDPSGAGPLLPFHHRLGQGEHEVQ